MAKLNLKADSVEELSKGFNPAKEVKKEAVDTAVKEEAQTESVKEQEENDEPVNEVREIEEQAPKKKRGRPRKIDQMSAKEAITLHTQRNTHAIQKADKESKQEIYSSEHVFVEEGEEAYLETESTVRKEEWLELVASAQENNEIDALKGTRILKGVMTSITEIPSGLSEDDPDYVPDYMAKVRFKTGQFQVSIPSFVLYYYDYKNLNKAMAADIQKNMMRRLGAEIDFVVR